MSTDTREALAACPFCGEAHDIEVDNSDHNRSIWVVCHGCGARGAIMLSYEQAVKEWNTRAALATQPAQPSTITREALAACPFCGERPGTTSRPDSSDETRFFAAVMCYCGGYSVCAHKMAVADTRAEADELAAAEWNRRAAQPSTDTREALAARELHRASAQGGSMTDHPDIVERLETEADLCRSEGADDIARLLEHAASCIGMERESYGQLMAENTRLRAEAAEFERVRDECDAENARFSAEILRLRAETEALRKDAERLNGLRMNLHWDGHAYWLPDLCIKEREGVDEFTPEPTPEEFRAAIDTAIAATKEQQA